jgi:uncharacterized membrane protein
VSEDGKEKGPIDKSGAAEPRHSNEPRHSDEFEGVDGEIVADEKGLTVDAAPDGQPQALATSRSLSLKLSTHRGPVPSPETFAKYEQILPGAADRLLTMAEKEGDHRRALELKQTDAAIATMKRGQIFGVSAFFVCLGAGVLMLFCGIPGVGIAAVFTSLGAMLVGAIWNKLEERKQRKLEEREQKTLEDAVKKADKKPPTDTTDGKPQLPTGKPPKKKKKKR